MYKLDEFGDVILRFASSQFISKVLNMIAGFAVIKLLIPEENGLFNAAGIYLGYVLFGSAGIINGLGRDLPYYMAKGDSEYAEKLASSVWVYTILLCTLSSIFFLGMSIYYFKIGEYQNGIVFLSYTIIGFLNLLNTQFLPVLYRSPKDFHSLSKQNIFYGLGNLISICLVYYYGFTGLILRGIVLAIYQFVLLFYNKPIKLSWKFELPHFLVLLKTGFPIFIVGYINVFWYTILNNLIITLGSTTYFGLFSLATVIQGAIGVIPSALSSITYPRMTMMYAEGKQVTEIITNFKIISIIQFFFMTVVAIITSFLLPILVPKILPKYIDGISAAQWMCFVPVVQSFDMFGNLYNVVKKQKWLIISLILGALFGAIFFIIITQFYSFYLSLFPQTLIVSILFQQFFSIYFLKELRNS